MPISELEFDATYDLSDGRKAVPYRQFFINSASSEWLKVVIHLGGNVTYKDYPKAKFMQEAIRKVKDPPSKSSE